jgi:hypothetical protein
MPAAKAGAISGKNCRVQLLRPNALAAADDDETALLRAAAHILTLIYILVVGQFGLATGSGGITQSNVHTTSRVHQKKNGSRPAAKVMVHSKPGWNHTPPALHNDHDKPAKRVPAARHPAAKSLTLM